MNRFGMAVITMLVTLASVSPAAAQAQGRGAAESCDRACLTGIADTYFAALGAKAPARAPVAPTAKFTENAEVLKIGEGGLWATATEPPTTFKIHVPDGHSAGRLLHERLDRSAAIASRA